MGMDRTDDPDDGSGVSRRWLLGRSGRAALLAGVGGVALADVAAATTCPRTPEFWATHPDAWPVETLHLGGQQYGREALLRLLAAPVGEDRSLALARQLAAYRLNAWELNDSCVLPGTTNWRAEAWVAMLGERLVTDDRVGTGQRDWVIEGLDGEPVAAKLAKFNEGRLELGCDCAPWEPAADEADTAADDPAGIPVGEEAPGPDRSVS